MDLPLALGVKLTSPLSLDYYTSFAQASTGGKKNNSLTLQPNKSVPIFVLAPTWNDKHVKGAMVGQYLKGSMTLAKVRTTIFYQSRIDKQHNILLG